MKKSSMFAFLFATAALVSAKEPGASLLAMNPSVHSESLGGVSSVVQGAESINLNPAWAYPLSKNQIYTSLTQIEEDTSFGHLAWVRALGRGRSAWGLSLSHVRSEPDPGFDQSGAPTQQNNSAVDTALSISLSGPWLSHFRWGLSGRLFRSELSGIQSNVGWAIDSGVGLRAGKVTTGVSVNNLGPGQTFLQQQDPLPAMVRWDVAWRPNAICLVSGIQWDLPRSATIWTAGLEYTWSLLSVRVGLNRLVGERSNHSLEGHSFGSSELKDLSAGLGVDLNSHFKLDYAVRQNTVDSTMLHRAALTLSWGSPKDSSAARTSEKQKIPLSKSPQKQNASPHKHKSSKPVKLGR